MSQKALSISDAGKWLANKWASLESRYGRKGALAAALGMLVTLPIPGNIPAVIATAEAIRGMSGFFGKECGDMVVAKSIKKGQLFDTNDEEMSATFVLSTAADDRDGETVDPEGGNFDEYSRNPVVAFNHDTDDFPIGTSADKDGKVHIWVDDVELNGQQKRALLGKCFFSKANPKGRLAYEMVKEGTLRGCSISFLPTGHVGKNNSGGNHYGEWKLLEWSVCPIGSNPDAVKLKLKFQEAQETWQQKVDEILQHTRGESTADYDATKVQELYERGESPKVAAMALARSRILESKEKLVLRPSGMKPRAGGMGISLTSAVQIFGRKLHDLMHKHGVKVGIGLAVAAMAHIVPHDMVHEVIEAWEAIHGSLRQFEHKNMKRKLWKNKNAAWVLKSEGPLDEETQAHIEEMGLDEVRIEDEEPPVEEGWEEEKAHDFSSKGEVIQNVGGYTVVRNKQGIYEVYDNSSGKLQDTFRNRSQAIYAAETGDLHKSASDLDEIKRIKSEIEDEIELAQPKIVDEEVVEECARNCNGDPELVKRAKRLIKKGLQKGPVGYQALKRWIKAIEDDLPNIEQQHVLQGADKALKVLKATVDRAYKDIDSPEEPEVEKTSGDPIKPGDKVEVLAGPVEGITFTVLRVETPYVILQDQNGDRERFRLDEVQRKFLHTKSISKRLSKSDRQSIKELSEYLEDAANNAPKHLSAGLKFYAQKAKDLSAEPEPSEPTTEEEEAMLEEAAKLLNGASKRLSDTFFQATGKRL